MQRALLLPLIGGEAGSCATNMSVCPLSAGQSYALLHHLTDAQRYLKRVHDSAPSTEGLKVS